MIDLKSKFPKLLSKIEDDIDDLRYLIVIDENYEDIDDEENDIFDPYDYNYLVYITEVTQDAVGINIVKELSKKIEEKAIFENFIESEFDLYGLKSDLDSDGVAVKILEIIEDML